MDRDTAILRLNRGMGFLPLAHPQTADFALALQEAQRDLEEGKTLPKFLLQEDQALTLTVATSTTALPTGFLRASDDEGIRYVTADSDIPVFLQRKLSLRDAIMANIREDNDPVAPSVYVIRKSVIDFITTANETYTLTWSYYKAADLLTSNIENAWLANAPEWLIGEAGTRLARDARDPDALTLFETMTQKGRAACFGETIAEEVSAGAMYMNEDA